MTPSLTVVLELQPEEAAALAQFLKRTRLDDYRAKCAPHDRGEAELMQAAAERLRAALAAAGADPR